MRPVADEFPVTQGFGSLATRGVHGDMNGSQVQVLVALYGDYQPDGHNGADLGCPVGTPVYAARSGTVVVCDWDVNLPGDDSWSASGYFQRFAFFKRFGGRLLVVKVAENDYDVYAHLSAWKVGCGQHVSEGQLVALSGDSSAGMDGQLGPHLHTERIVDLTYSTGNGLIHGRMDPTSIWESQGIAAMGGTITPMSEEDEMSQADTDEIKGNLQKVVPEVLDTHELLKGVNEKIDELVGNSRKTFWNSEESKIRLQSAQPAQVAADINAAGLASAVRDELVKLLGGK